MRVVLLAALLSLGGCALDSLGKFQQQLDLIDRTGDSILGSINPRLAQLENATAGMGNAIDDVVERRIAMGLPTDTSISLEEWLAIGGGTLTSVLGGLFGLNTMRTRSRKRDLYQKQLEDKLAIASRSGTQHGPPISEPRMPS